MYELADVLVIERYNLTRLVDRLEKEGLVSRTRLADDGRAALVAITDKGKALRKQMWAIYQATVAELFPRNLPQNNRQSLLPPWTGHQRWPASYTSKPVFLKSNRLTT